jgi:hypothetical protein
MRSGSGRRKNGVNKITNKRQRRFIKQSIFFSLLFFCVRNENVSDLYRT